MRERGDSDRRLDERARAYAGGTADRAAEDSSAGGDVGRARLYTLQDRWQEQERKLLDCQMKTENEREALKREAELNLYRTLETEREKWEARELRVVEPARRELSKCGLGVGSEMYDTMSAKITVVEGQLQGAKDKLENKIVVAQLQTERDAIGREREELRAEVAYLQARLRRLEHLDRTVGSGGAGDPSSLVASTTRRLATSSVAYDQPLRPNAPVFLPT